MASVADALQPHRVDIDVAARPMADDDGQAQAEQMQGERVLGELRLELAQAAALAEHEIADRRTGCSFARSQAASTWAST